MCLNNLDFPKTVLWDRPTRIKLCGLTRPEDISTANELKPNYIGFVFAKKSPRYVSPETAATLRALLDPDIISVGVFVNEDPAIVAGLLAAGTIGIAQLHGREDEDYIRTLRTLTDRPIIKAFRIDTAEDVTRASVCSADCILVDSGAGGTGTTFDWSLLQGLSRPFFLAGGLNLANAADALTSVAPFAVDISSGIETNGKKDPEKMKEFVRIVRDTDGKEQ